MMNNLKDLEKFLKLCRKMGVQSIRHGDTEVHLGEMPAAVETAARTQSKILPSYPPGGITPDTRIITDELTPEQLLMWSVDDPTELEGDV